jgi:taurine transport system ATP-binding protein
MGPKFDKLSNEEVNRVCDKYLDQVELSQYKNSKVFELSGGEKQRIAIARTLASHPEVILMDEPFSALDSFTRKKMQIMIRRLWIQNKVTIFFVTHDIDEALLLGTKIYVMRRGKNDIIKSYNSDYTHRLYKDTKLPVHQEDKYIKLKDEILSLLED